METKLAINHEAAKQLARDYIEETFRGYAYPIIPTDDDGNAMRYEVGCVPWVSCTSVSVDRVYVEDEELDANGDLTVLVDVFTTWTKDTKDDDDDDYDPGVEATYEVIIGYNDETKLVCFNYERVD
jgi:hypothetical protein